MSESKELSRMMKANTGLYDGKTAQQRKDHRRLLLIETAIALMGREGVAAVSLNRLCAEAGLTKRYFYESFSLMDDVVEQACQVIFLELKQDLIAQISSEKTPKNMIIASLTGFYGYLKNHPERARLFLIESLSIQKGRERFFDDKELSDLLILTSSQFKKRAEYSGPVLHVMAQSAVGAARFVGQKWIEANYNQPIDELVKGVSEICFGLGERVGMDLNQSLI